MSDDINEQGHKCPICGGVKRVDWTISFEECRPVAMQFDPASLAENWHLCPGHPVPAQKHDGRLDERGEYVVEYGCDSAGRTTVDVDEYDLQFKDHPDRLRLSPVQALSLIAWLIQEHETLERLATEQKTGEQPTAKEEKP